MLTNETNDVQEFQPADPQLSPEDTALAYLRGRLEQQDAEPTHTDPIEPSVGVDTAPGGVEGEPTAEPAPEGQERTEDEEPRSEEEPKKAEEDPRFASRFAALAREEKRIRKERDALKAQEAELSTFKAAIDKLKTDPLAALKELGVDYDELTRRVLSGGKPDASDEVKMLREKLEALERERQEQADREQQAQIQATFAAAKRELADLSRDATKYPLTSKWEPAEVAERAFAIIEQHFYETGKPLTYDEALSQIEARLVEHRRRLVGDEPQQPKPPAAPPKAITNRVVTSPGTAPAELSMEEREEAAIRYLRLKRQRR